MENSLTDLTFMNMYIYNLISKIYDFVSDNTCIFRRRYKRSKAIAARLACHTDSSVHKLAQFGQPSTLSRLDTSFAQSSKLQILPRLVFALLRNPLLQCHEEGVHPDYRIYLQCLFRYEAHRSLQCSQVVLNC